MSARARAAALSLAAGLSLLGAPPAPEPLAARADQAAFLDAATARRAAAAIAPGSDFVVWTCPSADVRTDEAPVLYRAREVVLVLAADHAEVRVTARRLAAAAPGTAGHVWSVAGPSVAEPLSLDLAYVFVPDPAAPGRFESLAARLGVEVEIEVRALTVPPSVLKTVAGPGAR